MPVSEFKQGAGQHILLSMGARMTKPLEFGLKAGGSQVILLLSV